jgi:xylulokinase
MVKRYLLGVDCGTYEAKAALCDAEGGVVATASAKYKLRVPKPGFAEHDPIEDWWKGLIAVVGGVLKDSGVNPREIAGVCVSTVMAAVTAVDAQGNPLRNAILYGIDTRSQPQADRLNEQIGAERLLTIGGALCSIEAYGPKILWIRENEPEIYQKTRCFTIAAGFLNHKLTDRFCVDRYSANNAQPMIDRRTMTWSDELCGTVCDPSMLPEIVPTTEIIGTVTKKAAEETGLCEGTPVLCGTTDGGADAISVGIVENGDCMVNFGSTIFLSYLGDQIPADSGLWSGEYVLPGLRCNAAGMATAGSLTRWIRDQLFKDLVAEEERGGGSAYDRLFAEAEGIPAGADGLLVLPYFMGERMPIRDPKAKGVIFGLNLTHTRGHIMRAALEGIAYGLDQNFDLIRAANQPLPLVTAVGGGTKSPLWMQIMSDVTGVTHRVPTVSIGAAYGDALLAGLGTGLIQNPLQIKQIIRTLYEKTPDLQAHHTYQRLKSLYAQLYLRNKDIMHEL